MEVRHQARFLGDQAPQIVVDLDRVERGQPQPLQIRHLGQQPADHLPQRRLAGQVRAVGGDIDAGQHDLVIAGLDQQADLPDDFADRDRA